MFEQNEDMLEMYAEFRDYPFNLIDEISEAIGDDWEYRIPGDLGGTVEYVLHTYLSLREKDVILLRFKYEKTLVEIAELLGISKERVRQIQTSALKRLCNPQCLNYLQNGIYKAIQDVCAGLSSVIPPVLSAAGSRSATTSFTYLPRD